MNTSLIRQQHLEYDRFFTKYIFVKKAVLLQIYIIYIYTYITTEFNTERVNTTHLKHKTCQSLVVIIGRKFVGLIIFTKAVACVHPSSIDKG